MMRIITGKAKGIKLKTLEGDATRPTSERVKEAVFSMLMGDIEDREILDLFSGSGQLALEALSRGARHATLVDKSPMAVKIITENSQKTRLAEGCTIVKDDCILFIKRNSNRKYDIVFLDPPYQSGLYAPILRAMLENNILKQSTLIICESGNDMIFSNDTALAERFEVVKQSRYSKTFITILSPKGNAE